MHLHFLWLELTLPDFLDARGLASHRAEGPRAAAADEIVDLRGAWSICQLLSVFLLAGGPVPERVAWRHDTATAALPVAVTARPGRLPEPPATPPPENG